jgi:hypothetical protein
MCTKDSIVSVEFEVGRLAIFYSSKDSIGVENFSSRKVCKLLAQ